MTFRAIPLKPEQQTFTVDKPESLELARAFCSGTTWARSEARWIDVMWLGQHLAIIKIRYPSGVEYRVVSRRDVKNSREEHRAALKRLSAGAFGLEHEPSKHGFLSPRRLRAWIIALEVADARFEKTLADVKAAKAEAEAKAEAAKNEAALSRRLFLEAVRNALQAAGIPFQPTATNEISVTVNGVSLHVTDEGNARTSVISANQFAAIVRAIRDN